MIAESPTSPLLVAPDHFRALRAQCDNWEFRRACLELISCGIPVPSIGDKPSVSSVDTVASGCSAYADARALPFMLR